MSSAQRTQARTAPRHFYTVPGLDAEKSQRITTLLQQRLVALIDLQLTLKHVHWNVVGATFIGVHLMLDPQVDGVRKMVDEIAERIATMGGEPNGLPGHLVESRNWDDYSLGRATVPEHLGALDIVYTGVITSHRKALEELGELDQVTQDILMGHTHDLEMYQWFVRAHLESPEGRLATTGATSETEAAAQSRKRIA
jgi:starvation-inducible DNA-binding protein